MSQPSLEERLLDLLYGDLDPETAAAVEAEIKTDPVLRERLEAWRQVRHAMAELPEPEPDPQVRYAILRAARQAVEAPEKKGIFAWLTAISLNPAFAALGLAVLGGSLWFALSRGYRDSEAPPESRLEKAATAPREPAMRAAELDGRTPAIEAEGVAPASEATLREREEEKVAPAPGEAALGLQGDAAGQAEPPPRKALEGALTAEPRGAAEPDPTQPARPEPTVIGAVEQDKEAAAPPKARRAPPRPAEAAAAEGRKAGKALFDQAVGEGRRPAKDTAADRGSGGGGLTAEDTFADVPPPADEAQTAGIREKKAKAPSPFPAEESEALEPQQAVAEAPKAEAPEAGAQRANDAKAGEPIAVEAVAVGAVAADADAVDARAVDAPQAPVATAATAAPAAAPAPPAVGDAEPALDQDEAAGSDDAVGAAPAGPPRTERATKAVARTPVVAGATREDAGPPPELLEARSARRRGDHEAAVDAYQRYRAGYVGDDQFAAAMLEAAQSYEALGDLGRALQLYRLAARSGDAQVARIARERIGALESLKKSNVDLAPAEAEPAQPAEPEQKPQE